MKKPVISVVIAAYNEESYLSACLFSLAQQEFPHPFEVVVVDNNSTDKTAAIAKLHGARVVRESRRIVARACHTGFMAARAPLIAKTDADTIVPKHWLATVWREFANDPTLSGISGPTYPLESSRAENIFYYPAVVLWMLIERVLGYGFFYGNMAFRKEAYLVSGGLDQDLIFGEDAYICKRLNEVGHVRMVLGFYIFASTRRVRAMGLFRYLATYVFGNYLRVWLLKQEPVAMQPVRLLPLPHRSLPSRPYLYVSILPVTLVLIISAFGLLQTAKGEALAQEVIADTKGAVSRQHVYLRRGATFIQNVKQNGLRYYQHWNRKESSYDTHELPANHQG